MTWRQTVAAWIEDHYVVQQEFTLSEFFRRIEPVLQQQYPQNSTLRDTLRNELQKLRDSGLLAFVDNDGTYRRLC